MGVRSGLWVLCWGADGTQGAGHWLCCEPGRTCATDPTGGDAGLRSADARGGQALGAADPIEEPAERRAERSIEGQ